MRRILRDVDLTRYVEQKRFVHVTFLHEYVQKILQDGVFLEKRLNDLREEFEKSVIVNAGQMIIDIHIIVALDLETFKSVLNLLVQIIDNIRFRKIRSLFLRIELVQKNREMNFGIRVVPVFEREARVKYFVIFER